MLEYIDKCKKCYHFQVCANVMKNQLFIREKMLLEENPECEHFIPAADVVEVVRCKDCKFHEVNVLNCGMEWCKKFSRITYFNDYCSYGERKDSNGNG